MQLIAQKDIVHKNFHALRHPHATKLLATGMAFMDVSHRLGHVKLPPDKQEKSPDEPAEIIEKITKDGLPL